MKNDERLVNKNNGNFIIHNLYFMSMSSSQKMNIRPAVERVLKHISDRNRDIVCSRFGIGREKKETLEAIGRRYGITRERVRQIEEASLAKMKTAPTFAPSLDPLFDRFKTFFEERGGFVSEADLVRDTVPSAQGPHLLLTLTLGDDFTRLPETDDFHALWTIDEDRAHGFHNYLSSLTNRVEKDHALLSWEELLVLAKEEAARHDTQFSADVIARHLGTSKNIQKGPLERYGLAHWPEVNPRGVRDRAHLVLQYAAKPLHFREITDLIGHLPFMVGGKKCHAHPQTVHNELIKDDRFVLVGRGLYGLKEWGFKPGTVCDVLVDTLQEAKRSLTKEELVAAALKQRFVQPNTILLNLQNKKYFRRANDGRYMLA